MSYHVRDCNVLVSLILVKVNPKDFLRTFKQLAVSFCLGDYNVLAIFILVKALLKVLMNF
jgi:hypothetical protein